MAPPQPDITLFFLDASRAIRIAWLLEELKLPYKLVASRRMSNNLAPPEFKAQIPTSLGKSPTLRDGELVVQESGAIVEYLCETYDAQHHLLPQSNPTRAKVREYTHAAEGTFLIHALAVLYARLAIPTAAKTDGTLDELERGLGRNVLKDLDWLEGELATKEVDGGAGGKGGREGGYLVGERLTAADVMVAFSIEFIFARGLGVRGVEGPEERWARVKAWLRRMQGEEGYRRAVQRTGYKL